MRTSPQTLQIIEVRHTAMHGDNDYNIYVAT